MEGEHGDSRHPAAVVPGAAVAGLVEGFDLDGPEEAMLLALETARNLARPPVSGYRVGAVGLAAGSGDLLLGGNLELVGASIAQTVHAEGFVTLLARARATVLTALALAQARPCAHCRQVLAEMDGAADLRLIDPLGHELALADLYPWPFAPADLGETGALPGSVAFPYLGLADPAIPDDVRAALVAAGQRSHAPYSGVPAALVLRLREGTLVSGAVLESVAFNPTIGPAQDALVGLLAAGRDTADVEAAWIAVPRAAVVGHVALARDALASIAPGAPFHVGYWT